MNLVNVSYNFSDIKAKLEQHGLKVDEQKLQSIFDSCDRYDVEGKEIQEGDGILIAREMQSFLQKCNALVEDDKAQTKAFEALRDQVYDEDDAL